MGRAVSPDFDEVARNRSGRFRVGIGIAHLQEGLTLSALFIVAGTGLAFRDP